MNTTLFIVAVIVIAGPVLISLVIEAMRTEPDKPAALSWAPDLPAQYILIDGIRLRYVKTGDGPPLVLLHTLRTQLDIFQKIIPELAKTFTVYTLDYPGHGWSDIPATDYTPAFFVDIVGKFLDCCLRRTSIRPLPASSPSIPTITLRAVASPVRT
jgi:hypothetical protein